MKLNFWTKDQDFSSGGWTTVYQYLSGHMVSVYGLMFHISTSKAYLRVEYPGISWEADLDEIYNDYKLKSNGGFTIPKWIYSTDVGRFVIEFPDPVPLQGDFVIKLKSVSGTKTLYRGFTVTGDR